MSNDTISDDPDESAALDLISELAGRLASLESRVERQQQIIETQQEAGADVGSSPSRSSGSGGISGSDSMTRRGMLTAGGLVALLGLGIGPASADTRGQVGTRSDPLKHLFTSEIRSGTAAPLTLATDGSRTLRLGGESSGSAGNVVAGHSSNGVPTDATGATISGGGYDDGSTSEPNEVYSNFGTVGGGRNNKAGTESSGKSDYTTVAGGKDNKAWYDYATVGGGEGNRAVEVHCTVSGGKNNSATSQGATIGGGANNSAGKSFGTVGGGRDNSAYLELATVAGGSSNKARGVGSAICGGVGNSAVFRSFVGGGHNNSAPSRYSTVAGGEDNVAGNEDKGGTPLHTTVGGGYKNTASGSDSTVGGGWRNTASGSSSTVPGGANNTADGDYSFAAGYEADTNGHDGAFVLGDSSDTAITAENDDEVRSQMPMYAPSFNTTSARAKKTNLGLVDPQDALDGVQSLDVHTWEFTDTDDGRHIGPMAEDFQEAFDLESDAETIATVDADGVAFAAIQGLAEQNDELAERNDELAERNDELAEEVATKDDRIEALETENDELRERVTAVEERIEGIESAESSPTSADD